MAKSSRCRGKGAGTLVLRGKTWCARWTVNGKVFTKTTGTSSRREAEKVLADITAPFRLGGELAAVNALADKAAGIDRELDQLKDGQPALSMLAAWEVFAAEPKGRTPRGRVIMPGPRTLADYEGRWRAFCEWLDATYPTTSTQDGVRLPREVRSVTPEQARRYIRKVEVSRSAGTRNKTLTFLRLAFKVLAGKARVRANPFDGLDAAPEAALRKRTLQGEELRRVSALLEGQGEMEVLFSLGYYTGARLGDCATLRWEMVDMGACKIRYTPRKTKKTSGEVVLDTPPALHALLGRTPKAQRRGYVMPELAELYGRDPSALTKRVQAVFRDAGIETALEVKGYGRRVAQVGFHSLRHGHITALLEGGAPMESVRARVGHADISMTAKYFHEGGAATARAVRALPEFGHADASPASADAVAGIMDALTSLSVADLESVARAASMELQRRTGGN